MVEALLADADLDQTRLACVAVFEARAAQPWPSTIRVLPHWPVFYDRAREELDLEREVGIGPVSPLVNDALAMYLRRQRGLAAVASYEAERGAFTDGELAEADSSLDAAGVLDLRAADVAGKPRKRARAKQSTATRRRRS